MLRDNLGDKISHVNRVRAACADSHLATISLDGEIGSVTSQMKPVQRADPDSRSCRYFKSLAHRNTLFPRVEILIADPGLDWLGLQVLAQNFVVLWKNRGAGKNHSERRACITSTRAARAAGSIEATTAAPNSTNAETITGHAPGIFRSPK